MQLFLDPDSLNPQDATATLYFEEFVLMVQGPWTTAVSNNDLWTSLLPQVAHNHDALRSAAMAIGALSMWHRQSGYRSFSQVSVPSSPTATEHVHYFNAVGYYCRSLKLHHQQVSSQGMVFLSVLLLLFEMLRGNRKAALDHANHGLAMLLTLLTDEEAHQRVENFAPNPKPLLGVVADVFTQLATDSHAILHGRIGEGPALPNLHKGLRTKRQTVGAFLTSLSQLSQSSAIADRIPTVFNNLDEFEECWIVVRRRHTTMTVIMLEIVQSSGILTSVDENYADKLIAELLGNPRIRDFCKVSIRLIEELDTAFLPLFNKFMLSDTSSPSYLKSIHLRLQVLGIYLFEDPPQFLDVQLLHKRTPKFREYLSLARAAIRSARQEMTNLAHQVTLQCGLAWHLLIVSCFCRDSITRDEATWMLGEYPGQDGLWNTRALYALASRNRDLEKDNAVEGTQTEQWRRLLRREFVFEEGGDRILFRFLRKDELSGGWILAEEVAETRQEVTDVHWKRQKPIGNWGNLMAELYHV